MALHRKASKDGLAWHSTAVVIATVVAIPVGVLAFSVLSPSVDVWRQQWNTRLPRQLIETSILLCGVGVGSLLVGGGLAWLVSAYQFPGSRVFTWLLIAPLAVPSYVLGLSLIHI